MPPGTFSCSIFHAKLDATGIQIEGTPEKIETSGGVTEVAMSRPRTPGLSPDQRTLYFERAGRLPSAARE